VCGPTSALMPMTALVVDDSMLIRYTVSQFLARRGFVVESASNGEEALEAVARVIPTLVITDMVMPRMSGAELISALKSKPETASVPVIILAYKAGIGQVEKDVSFAIYKDIDIEAQLGRALDAVLGKMGQKSVSRD